MNRPNRLTLPWLTALGFILLAGSLTLPASAQANAQFVSQTMPASAIIVSPAEEAATSVNQWRRWEGVIRSGRDFTVNGGNPYRDLILRVRFTELATGASFVQDAFWEAKSAAPRDFKVRGAFAPGLWSWQVDRCTGTTGGLDCAVETWTPSSGTITVNSLGSSQRLYKLGLLKQDQLVGGAGWGGLTYGSSDRFFWLGDTAWAAPPREISGSTTAWKTYLDNRQAKGFTVIQIAPAVTWQPKSTDTWLPLPLACGFSFNQRGGCSPAPAVIPNSDSTPRPEYWEAFDTLVQQANNRDLVVAILGLINPVGAKAPNYPGAENVKDFSRYLAARMAGSAVILSPGFDDKITATASDGNSLESVMLASGTVIKAAAPRLLVTNHLAGGSPCTDYQRFQTAAWMTFYLFQSGHAFSAGGNIADECPQRLSGETRLRAATRRALQIPITLSSYLQPAKPVINGEGPYDKMVSPEDELDNRLRSRQVAYSTFLSNGRGFTYGAFKIYPWEDLGTGVLNAGSAQDMVHAASLFCAKDATSGRCLRDLLTSRPTWICNQVADPLFEQKMTIASSSNRVVAYLPKGAPANLEISSSSSGIAGRTCTSGLVGLSSSTWTKKWIDPTTGAEVTGGAFTGTNPVVLSKPACPAGNPDCDFVLEITR